MQTPQINEVALSESYSTISTTVTTTTETVTVPAPIPTHATHAFLPVNKLHAQADGRSACTLCTHRPNQGTSKKVYNKVHTACNTCNTGYCTPCYWLAHNHSKWSWLYTKPEKTNLNKNNP